jgi:hypothetical protein
MGPRTRFLDPTRTKARGDLASLGGCLHKIFVQAPLLWIIANCVKSTHTTRARMPTVEQLSM